MEMPAPMDYSTPLVRRYLSDLKHDDSRDEAIKSLRQQVLQMEPSAIPRFVHHVSESSGQGTPKKYAVALYGECARKHGPNIIPHIPKIIGSMIRQMSQDWCSSVFQEACASTILEIVRYGAKDHRQAEDVVGFVAEMLSPSLTDRCEPLATGAAVCLEALISCEKWKTASESTAREAWRTAVQAVADPLRMVAHLQLALALTRTGSNLLQEHAKLLLSAALEVLTVASQWQRRLYAVKLIAEVLSRCEEATFHDEVEEVESVLISCEDEPMERVREEMESLRRMIASFKGASDTGPRRREKNEKSACRRPCWDIASKPGGGSMVNGNNLHNRMGPGNEEFVLGPVEADAFSQPRSSPVSQRKLQFDSAMSNSPLASRYNLPTRSSIARSRESFTGRASNPNLSVSAAKKSPSKSSSWKGKSENLKAAGGANLTRTKSDTAAALECYELREDKGMTRSCGSVEQGPSSNLTPYYTVREIAEGIALQECSGNSSGKDEEQKDSGARDRPVSRAESDGSSGIQNVNGCAGEREQVVTSQLFTAQGLISACSSLSIGNGQVGFEQSSGEVEQWLKAGGEKGHGLLSSFCGDISESISSDVKSAADILKKLGKEHFVESEGRTSLEAKKAHKPMLSRDSSRESLSGCASTTSSSAGRPEAMRLVRPLESGGASASKKSTTVTKEDLLINWDPKKLLISLQSGTPESSKGNSRQASSATSVARERQGSASGMESASGPMLHEVSTRSSDTARGEDHWQRVIRKKRENAEAVDSGEVSAMGSQIPTENVAGSEGYPTSRPARDFHEGRRGGVSSFAGNADMEDELSAVDLVEDREHLRESVATSGKTGTDITGGEQQRDTFTMRMIGRKGRRRGESVKKFNDVPHIVLKTEKGSSTLQKAKPHLLKEKEQTDTRVEKAKVKVAEKADDLENDDKDEDGDENQDALEGDEGSLVSEENDLQSRSRSWSRVVVGGAFWMGEILLEFILQGCVLGALSFHTLLLVAAIYRLSQDGLDVQPT